MQIVAENINIDVFKAFLRGKTIGYHPDVTRVCGSVTAGVLLHQLMYWSDKGSRDDGWIWKTQEEIERETAISPKAQKRAREKLVDNGFITEKLMGMPAKMHFKVDFVRVISAISDYYNDDRTSGDSQFGRNVQTSIDETSKQVSTKRPNKYLPNVQTSMDVPPRLDWTERLSIPITKITAESTQHSNGASTTCKDNGHDDVQQASSETNNGQSEVGIDENTMALLEMIATYQGLLEGLKGKRSKQAKQDRGQYEAMLEKLIEALPVEFKEAVEASKPEPEPEPEPNDMWKVWEGVKDIVNYGQGPTLRHAKEILALGFSVEQIISCAQWLKRSTTLYSLMQVRNFLQNYDKRHAQAYEIATKYQRGIKVERFAEEINAIIDDYSLEDIEACIQWMAKENGAGRTHPLTGNWIAKSIQIWENATGRRSAGQGAEVGSGPLSWEQLLEAKERFGDNLYGNVNRATQSCLSMFGDNLYKLFTIDRSEAEGHWQTALEKLSD